jgi:predicted AlkP superfamily phosphohydrolase/phosphomutase
MKRRDFIKSTGFLLTFPSLFTQSLRSEVKSEKLLILGFDGMDPGIVMSMVKRGELPNIQKFISRGSFAKMISTAPPISPCAWASFLTGLDPAGHGIFGFLNRNAETYQPYSTSAPITTASKTIGIGEWQLPYLGGDSHIFRKGKPFWEYLHEKDIDTTIFKMPSNYPPSEMKMGRAIAGMGTPDIYGAQGKFTLYTTDEEEIIKDVEGKGYIYPIYFDDNNAFDGILDGPENTLKQEPEETHVKFKVYWDKKHKTARIDIQGKEILIQEGGMSEWIEVEFDLIPHITSVSAITQFYLLEADEKFRLYIYPPSINPADPAQTICSPSGYGKELTKQVGLFHTLGLPADFNGIKKEVLSLENYIVQSNSIFQESKDIFKYEFARFLQMQRGLLFYYFSSIDQGSHIYWALRDPEHPYHNPDEAKRYGDQVEMLYKEYDKIVGDVTRNLPADIPLIMLSDHGFAPYRRKINVNTLLYKHGFLKSFGEPDYSDPAFFFSDLIDLDQTRAYTLGLNAIYINQRGREGNGIVDLTEKRGVMEEIKKVLLNFTDPKTGEKPIGKVFITEDMYKGKHLNLGPDLIIGCNRSYGLDYSAALGGINRQPVVDNLSRWSGDHIIDPHQVPAVLMTSFKISKMRTPAIWDMAPTILKIFGIPTPAEMRGKSII